MDKQLLREYRERYRVLSEIQRQEQQTATLARRWQQLNALLNLAIGLGITSSSVDDIEIVRRRWVTLKERYEHT